MSAMMDQTKELLWDVSVYAMRYRVCLLALSVAGIAFVDSHRHLGESFGNGLILEPDAAEVAFEAADALELVIKTMG